MCAVCNIKPSIKTNKGEKTSKLFDDLLKFYGNRETAIEIYALVTTPTFASKLDSLGIQKDEFGEPTITSLQKKLNLDVTTDNLYKDKLNLNAVDNNGEIVYYKNTSDIIQRLIDYNKTHPFSVAKISKNEQGYYIDVVKFSESTFEIQRKLAESNQVFQKLLPALNAMGFTIKIDSTLVEDGMFDPMNAEATAEGLLEVISVADGERGAIALTEELAHTFVEGLKDTPLMARLINSIGNANLVRDILGSSYDRYSALYNSDSTLLLREAAAHVIMDAFGADSKDSIRHRSWYDKIKTIVDRVKNLILRRVSGKAKIIRQIQNDAKKIASEIYSGEAVKDTSIEGIKLSPRFYAALKIVDDMLKTLNEGTELLTRDYNIKKERAFRFSKNKNLQDYSAHIIEITQLLKDYDARKSDSYKVVASGLSKFIKLSGEKMKEAFDQLKISSLNDPEEVKAAALAYNNLVQYRDSFLRVLKKIRAMGAQDAKILGITQPLIATISQAASELVNEFEDNLNNIAHVKFYIAKELFRTYLGINPEAAIYAKKDKMGKLHAVTLDMLLQMAEKDLSRLDSWAIAFGDTSDALFSLVAKLVRNQKNSADDFVRDVLVPRIISANSRLRNAGITDTSFMYETVILTNRQGKNYRVTHIISNIDWVKYNEAMNAAFDEIDARDISKSEKTYLRDEWLRANNDINEANHEYTPKLEYYSKDDAHKIENTLNAAQYEYYQEMMREAPKEKGDKPEGIKRLIENTMLPEGKRRLYRPIYVRDDVIEAASVKGKNVAQVAKIAIKNIEDKFIRRVDEDEFGNQSVSVQKRLDGTFRETIPLMYVSPLENIDRLSMDFTQSIIAYAVTSSQYAAMEEIVDGIELIRNILKERKVTQKRGNIHIRAAAKKLGMKQQLEDLKLDYSQHPNRMVEAYDNFIANIVYGRRKEDEGTIHIFGHDTNIDKAKVYDFVRYYTTQAGLGLNPFSGISNLVMGKFQFYMEQFAGEFFNGKNALVAEKRYAFFLPQYLSEMTSTRKINTMALFIDKFNALDSYREELKRKGYYNSLVGRIFGEDLTLLFQTAGEHRLHVLTMFAILDSIKCKEIDPKTGEYVKMSSGKDKTLTLFDAFEKVLDKDENGKILSAVLKVKDNIVLEDGRKITSDYINDVRNLIYEVNGRMHGKFNADDRGNMNRWGALRLVTQFRQWMITHYRRRYEGSKYNAVLGYEVEGFYVTLAKLIGEIYKTAIKGEFSLATLQNHYSHKHKIGNLRRALFEIMSFAGLCLAISLSSKPKDLKGKWAQRMFLYTALRLRTEIGASIPSPWHLAENLMTLLQSPAASLSKMNAFVDLLAFWDMFNEIDSGRYKGMSVWRRNLYEAVPYLGPINKMFDLTTEDYMFTPFGNSGTKFKK